MNSDFIGSLSEGEIFWRDHYAWLGEQGYALRPRYKPDWSPTWKNSGRSPYAFEDGLRMIVRTEIPDYSL